MNCGLLRRFILVAEPWSILVSPCGEMDNKHQKDAQNVDRILEMTSRWTAGPSWGSRQGILSSPGGT